MSNDDTMAISGDGLFRARRVGDHIRIETREPKPAQTAHPWTPWRHVLMVPIPQDRPTILEII